MEEIRCFVGFDTREAVVYHACVQSILEHTDPNGISIHPVSGLRRDGSNNFTFARYLVPYRCDFRGIAIWLDGDMLVRADIRDLAEFSVAYFGARVVKHDYQTKFQTKYLGAPNPNYERKNWASVVVWNCSFYPHRILTPEFVAKADPMYLRQLRWLRDDQIGDLPPSWNRLVLEQQIQGDDRLRHFTVGAPCFPEYADSPGANEWFATLARAIMPIGDNDSSVLRRSGAVSTSEGAMTDNVAHSNG